MTKKVIYVIDNPRLPFNPRASKRKLFDNQIVKFPKSAYESNKTLNIYNEAVMNATKSFDNVKVLDLTKLYCDDKYCYSTDNRSENGYSIYREGDPGHLNARGSLMIAPFIKEAVDSLNVTK